MKKRGFKDLDSLDKFLTIYMKFLEDSINSCKADFLKDIYVKEKHFILTIVDLVRYIEKLTPEQLIRQLKEFEKNPELEAFIIKITSLEDVNIDEIKNTALKGENNVQQINEKN